MDDTAFSFNLTVFKHTLFYFKIQILTVKDDLVLIAGGGKWMKYNS